MDTGQPSGASKLEIATALASLSLFAAALLVMGWLALPQHRKTQMNLGLLRLWRRALSRHARRTAARSMALELATGHQDYEASYRLALQVDRLDARMNLIRQGLA